MLCCADVRSCFLVHLADQVPGRVQSHFRATKMSKQTIILCFLAALSWSVVSAQYYLVPPSGFRYAHTISA